MSGIAATHALQAACFRVELVERAAVLGGRIGPAQLEGHPVELGGKNIGRRYAKFRALAAALGEDRYEHIGINTARVAKEGLKTIDSSRRWSSFLAQLGQRSVRDLSRLAGLVLKIKLDSREGFLGGPGFRRLAAKTDDPTAAEYFTPAFCENALRPMGLLMNAAEPAELHLGNLGTNLSMALDDYDQLEHGMGALLDRVAAGTSARLSTQVESLIFREGRVVGLRLSKNAGPVEEVLYDGVLLATPADVSASLLSALAPTLASELRGVRYFPTAVIVARYDKPVFTPEVRALRFDEGEPLSGARAYGKSRLEWVRYTFSGSAARPLLEGKLDAERLLEIAEASLGKHFPVTRGGRRAFVAPERALALCAYSKHHAGRMDRIAQASVPGLHLTGDYLRGASLEACCRAAAECVEAIVAHHRESHVRPAA